MSRLLKLPPEKHALLVNELAVLIVSQREGRDSFQPEAVAADIIDRVLRRTHAAEPVIIEGTKA